MKIFSSPSLYLQGKHALLMHTEKITQLGENILIISNGIASKVAAEPLMRRLKQQKDHVMLEDIADGSDDEVTKYLISVAEKNNTQIVIGVGGGKIIDIAKVVANGVSSQLVIVPTVASTDAPTSRLSAIYDNNGSFQKYQFFQRSPDLIIVDTEIIVHAPKRTLIAGIADALATKIEGDAVRAGHGTNMLGGQPTITAIAIAEKAEETLFQHALLAVKANEQGIVDEHFDKIVEANILLSGLGFESVGEAAAHSIANGLTKYVNQSSMHGEKVAFGLLCQLMLSQVSEQTYQKYLELLLTLGLPVTLAELGLTYDDHILEKIARETLNPKETIYQMNIKLTTHDIVQVMKKVDETSRMFNTSHKIV
ncbi:glycerol dehydrogenase [uncultured Leuconostoc sp.]|uniref:glycerol dehydrogenase n=1 Tax=uncultured Leuconostoc sp. TaxID=173262 RepID=UPI0025EDE30B|nr:glycerol dehydrogenase [uncultured Leuconostoc sp.]